MLQASEREISDDFGNIDSDDIDDLWLRENDDNHHNHNSRH